MAKVGDDARMAGGTKEDDDADEGKGARMAMDANGAEGDTRMAEVILILVGAKEACEEAGVVEGGIKGIKEWCAQEREDTLVSGFWNLMRLFIQSTNRLW